MKHLLLGIARRDLRIAFQQKAELVQPIMFLLMVVTLFPLGVSPAPETLQRIGPRRYLDCGHFVFIAEYGQTVSRRFQ